MPCCAEKTNLTTSYDLVLPDELAIFIQQWKGKQGNLIPVLHKVQEVYGYIPDDVAQKVASELDKTLAQVRGVITFYHLFNLNKPGKYQISICMGTACYLKGANELLQESQNLLGIKLHETSEDGLFSLETVRCVGCCGLAPVIMINDDVYGNLTKEDLPGILAKYTQNKTKDS